MKRLIFTIALFAFATLLFGGCGYYYTVKRGDTVYSIAQKYGVSQEQLMESNDISDPRKLPVGKKLRIPRDENRGASAAKTAKHKGDGSKAKNAQNSSSKSTQDAIEKVRKNNDTPVVVRANTQFIWPVKGVVVRPYGKGADGRINDGVDIGAPEGSHIVAVEDGEVIFSSDKFPAYGNMVVVKHNNNLATLYAHNRVNLVDKGTKVTKGQVIAEVGTTGRVTNPTAHFEVRIGSTPVNPMEYLASPNPEEE